MNHIELNIGLNIGTKGQRVPAAAAIQAVVDTFLPRMIIADVRQAASGEDTLVVIMASPVSMMVPNIDRLCALLHQDCIAGKFNGHGFLIGPNTEPYGDAFNADYWLTLGL